MISSCHCLPPPQSALCLPYCRWPES
jgi:hypothetical protein